jgi:hypothetical protein
MLTLLPMQVVEQVNARFRKFKLIGERFPHQSVAQLPHWCAIAIALLNEEDCYKPYYANGADIPEASDECVEIPYTPRPASLESTPIPKSFLPRDDRDYACEARARLCGKYSRPPDSSAYQKEFNKLEQGTTKWLAARVGKVTASQLAPLIGVGRFKTPQKQWEICKGKTQEKLTPFIEKQFERGHRVEEMVRSKLPELMEGALGLKIQVKECGSWCGPEGYPKNTSFLASPDAIIIIPPSNPVTSTSLAPAPSPASKEEEEIEEEVEDNEDSNPLTSTSLAPATLPAASEEMEVEEEEEEDAGNSYCLLEVKAPNKLSTDIHLQYVLQVHMQCWCTGVNQCLLIQAVEEPFAITAHLFQIEDGFFEGTLWQQLLENALSVLESEKPPGRSKQGEIPNLKQRIMKEFKLGEDVTHWFQQDILSMWPVWSECSSFASFDNILPHFPKLPFGYITKVLRVLSLRHASDPSTIRRARKHFLNVRTPFTKMEYLYNHNQDILILKCSCPASMYCHRNYNVAVYISGLFTKKPSTGRAGDSVVTPKCMSLCSCVNGPSGNCGHIATLFCFLSDLDVDKIRRKQCQPNRYERGLHYLPQCCTSPPAQ